MASEKEPIQYMNLLRNLKISINLINMTCTVFSIEYSIRALAVFYTKVFKGNFSNAYFSLINLI